MIRTLISLEDEEKQWLDRRSKEEGVTMTEVVRKAVKRYRRECEAKGPSYRQLLEQTAGLSAGGEDGLAAQERLRAEWEEG